MATLSSRPVKLKEQFKSCVAVRPSLTFTDPAINGLTAKENKIDVTIIGAVDYRPIIAAIILLATRFVHETWLHETVSRYNN